MLLVEAKMFYFTSDLLAENGAEYTLNADTEKVRFTLNNYEDQFRMSDDEIQYAVYINDVQYGATSVLNETKSSVTIEMDVENGHVYEVKAVGVAGYEKTLSATFTVLENKTGFYKSLDTTNRNYVLLTVWTQMVSGDVEVSFPAGLIPDTTDSDMAGTENYVDGAYKAGKLYAKTHFENYTSKTYRFFKENLSATYTVDDFTVTVGERTAEPGTP